MAGGGPRAAGSTSPCPGATFRPHGDFGTPASESLAHEGCGSRPPVPWPPATRWWVVLTQAPLSSLEKEGERSSPASHPWVSAPAPRPFLPFGPPVGSRWVPTVPVWGQGGNRHFLWPDQDPEWLGLWGRGAGSLEEATPVPVGLPPDSGGGLISLGHGFLMGGWFCPPGDIWQRLETVEVVAARGNACWRLAVEARCSSLPWRTGKPGSGPARGEGTSPPSRTLPAREEVAGGPGAWRQVFGWGRRWPRLREPSARAIHRRRRGPPPPQKGFSFWTQEAQGGGPWPTRALLESPEVSSQKRGLCCFWKSCLWGPECLLWTHCVHVPLPALCPEARLPSCVLGLGQSESQRGVAQPFRVRCRAAPHP